jgi:general secretion pathway protein G
MTRSHSAVPSSRVPGFTLIEVMVVVVILAILASIIVPNVINKPEEARITKAEADIRSIDAALEMYKLDNYRYPTTNQGLAALVRKPTTSPVPHHWHRYLNHVPIDPWGHPYKYIHPGIHGGLPFNVWTDGPPGHHHVIGNWTLDAHGGGSP